MAEIQQSTTDHTIIQQWMEERGARPAAVKNTLAGDAAGVLFIDFPGMGNKDVDEISWQVFFKKFDEENLAFAYADTELNGDLSRDCLLVARDTGEPVRA